MSVISHNRLRVGFWGLINVTFLWILFEHSLRYRTTFDVIYFSIIFLTFMTSAWTSSRIKLGQCFHNIFYNGKNSNQMINMNDTLSYYILTVFFINNDYEYFIGLQQMVLNDYSNFNCDLMKINSLTSTINSLIVGVYFRIDIFWSQVFDAHGTFKMETRLRISYTKWGEYQWVIFYFYYLCGYLQFLFIYSTYFYFQFIGCAWNDPNIIF
jgi:hypothetical protein